MCMCIVFAFLLIRAKEVRIDIEVKRSEEKLREVMPCDVSPVAMFLIFQEKLGEALKIITRTISHLNVVESQEIKVLMNTFMGRTWRTRGNFKLYD